MRDSNNQLKASYINSGINKYITPKHVYLSFLKCYQTLASLVKVLRNFITVYVIKFKQTQSGTLS